MNLTQKVKDAMTHLAAVQAFFERHPDAHFFRCKQSKAPAVPRKTSWQDAGNRLTVKQVVERIDKGYLMGLIPWSVGCAVVDVDGGQADNGHELPEPVASYQTPSGGQHVYYALSEPIAQYPWKHDQGHGDTRCSDGYVCVWDPPALFGMNGGDVMSADSFHAAFPRKADETKPPRERTIADLEDMLTGISADCTYHEWFEVLCSVKAFAREGISEVELQAAAQRWSQSAPGRYDEKVFATTWESIDQTGGIGPGTLVQRAKGGHGGRRQGAGRPSANPKNPDAPHDVAVVCAGSDNWGLLGGQLAHYDEDAGLWTVQKSRLAASETACSEYARLTKGKGLTITSGIRTMVADCITGILQSRNEPEPEPERNLWPFADEVIDVSKSEAMDYERGHRFTTKLDYAPDEDSEGRPELFGRFLYSAFQTSEMVHWAERLLTYILFEENRHQRLIVWQGVPGSGKGVLMGLLADMMGRQHLATLNEKLAWEEATWALMPLAGARVAILSETNRGLPAHMAKAITGHDQIAAAPKGGHQIEFVYKGHLIYTTNKQLNLSDPGMERRLLTLPFTGKPDEPDPMLPAKLRSLRPQTVSYTHLTLPTKA